MNKTLRKTANRSGNADLRLTGRVGVEQRKRIRERDNYCCQMCGRATPVGAVDHKVALVNGGSNDDTNLQLLCDPCHEDKTRADLGQRVKTGTNASGMPTSVGHHWNT